MSPFQPTSVPAERYLAFSNDIGEVSVFDETVLQERGVSFTAEWQSPSLNRGDLFRRAVLHFVAFYYLYDGQTDTSFLFSTSGDGGVTWSADVIVPVKANDNILFAAQEAEGKDLRFRVKLDQDPIFTIVGFHPRVKPAGRADIG